ncbi:MAG: lipid-A-disaccharide synthase [Bacteroidales bacterium]
MRYYIIAGEASGDIHGSNLIRALKQIDQDAEFRCWGGDRMEQAGGRIVQHIRELAFMGFAEVIANLPEIRRNFRFCRQDMEAFQPDAVILIDYPGFNLRMAPFIKSRGYKLYYYISPQVWAWKKSRVKTISRYVDRMLVILPFEKEFYREHGVGVDYVGHPLLDELTAGNGNDDDKISLEREAGSRLVALLPGSRMQEIKKMLPEMAQVSERFPGYHFEVSLAPSIREETYRRILEPWPEITLSKDNMHRLLRRSRAAIVTSGTATLETALLNVPQVVCYKSSPLSYFIARQVVDKKYVRYISLVNLIAGYRIVPELIQKDMNREKIAEALEAILKDGEARREMLTGYGKLKKLLGEGGASARAAEIITTDLMKHS